MKRLGLRCRVLTQNGRTEYKNADGEYHRIGGPAIVYPNGGSQYWFINGIHTRDDGPATVEENGNRFWRKNGVLHRENGPAEETRDHRRWYLDGKQYSEQSFNEEMARRRAQ